jgi:hypothetical protein
MPEQNDDVSTSLDNEENNDTFEPGDVDPDIGIQK